MNNIQFYTYYKYIRENSNRQNKQFNDVFYSILFAKKENSDTKHKVLFICDEKYFNNTRINELNNTIKNKNHKVLRINGIENYLKNI